MSGAPNVRQRPGLAKGHLPLVATRGPSVRALDPAWRPLLEAADVVSEGSVRREGGASVWYGSTSLIVALPSEHGAAARAFLAEVAARDPHLRLRALRLARREAGSRAPAPLGRLACEIRFSTAPEGVRIDVDVQAPLIEGRHLGTSGR